MILRNLLLLVASSHGFVNQPVSPLRPALRSATILHQVKVPEGSGAALDPSLKLLLCLVIDFIGISSFAAPGIGESTDIAWAPISALLVNYLFGNGLLASIDLVEELLPGFDVIPTATIAWVLDYIARSQTSEANKTSPSSNSNRKRKSSSVLTDDDDDYIDVSAHSS